MPHRWGKGNNVLLPGWGGSPGSPLGLLLTPWGWGFLVVAGWAPHKVSADRALAWRGRSISLGLLAWPPPIPFGTRGLVTSDKGGNLGSPLSVV